VLASRLDTATTREGGGGFTETTMLEFVGYVAAGLVFATFYMKTTIPLRLVGITSNITFLVYSWFANVVPLFVLHSALLPLNIWRLMQIRALLREVRKVAVGDLALESLLPFMSPRRAEAGEILFHRGDAAVEMFQLLSGAVRLEELGITLGPGAILGEISMFAPRRERTGTAVCDTDVELLSITADKVMQLYYQNPRFGFHVVRLITGRRIENLRRVEPVSASDAGPCRDQELPEGGPVMGVARPAPTVTAERRARAAPLADRPLRWCRGSDHPARRRLAAGALPPLHGEPQLGGDQLDPRRHLADRRQSRFALAQAGRTGRARRPDRDGAQPAQRSQRRRALCGRGRARRSGCGGAAAVCRRHAQARRRMAGPDGVARRCLQAEPRGDPDLGTARARADPAAVGDRPGGP
jgi:hypothetical protein